MDGPNPIEVAWRILRALLRVKAPSPSETGTLDHSDLQPALDALNRGGIPALLDSSGALEGYLSELASIDPDELSESHSLAYWLNLYNAGAMALAVKAFSTGVSTVLRVPGGFGDTVITVAGEQLTLDDIEHGKIRRFGDPRVHGALVCGALSCPTLRGEPYGGDHLDEQLDDQMRVFLARGGAAAGPNGSVSLSRVFLWYGSDFVRPHRMPAILPARRVAVLRSLASWMPDDLRGRRRVTFQDYDWGLACKVA